MKVPYRFYRRWRACISGKNLYVIIRRGEKKKHYMISPNKEHVDKKYKNSSCKEPWISKQVPMILIFFVDIWKAPNHRHRKKLYIKNSLNKIGV